MNKRIVLLAGPDSAANIIVHALAPEFAVERCILEGRVGRVNLLRRRVKKLGLATVLGQIGFQLLVVPWLKSRSARRLNEIKRQYHLDESPLPESIILRVPSVNSEACIQELQRIAPSVVVIAGTRIISDKVLGCVPAVFINLHAGITPLYRGVHGAYWALVERKRDRCGVTAHVVDSGIDTGTILGQATIDPMSEDNFVTYRYLQIAAGIPLLKSAVSSLLEGNLKALAAPAGESRMWSHPTIAQYLRYRIARGVK